MDEAGGQTRSHPVSHCGRQTRGTPRTTDKRGTLSARMRDPSAGPLLRTLKKKNIRVLIIIFISVNGLKQH